MTWFEIADLDHQKRSNKIYGLLLFAVIISVSFLIDPLQQDFLSCYFLEATGHNCPTCGMSRSCYAMAQADILTAFNYHAFGPLMFTLSLILFSKFAIELTLQKNIAFVNIVWLKAVTFSILFLWLLFWFLEEFIF